MTFDFDWISPSNARSKALSVKTFITIHATNFCIAVNIPLCSYLNQNMMFLLEVLQAALKGLQLVALRQM